MLFISLIRFDYGGTKSEYLNGFIFVSKFISLDYYMLFQIIFIIISVFCKSYSSRYSGSSSKVVFPHSITTVNLRSQLPQQNTVGARWSEGQVELNLKYLALFHFFS